MTLSLRAQTGHLTLDYNWNFTNDSSGYTLVVRRVLSSDTVLNYSGYAAYSITLSNLPTGPYQLEVFRYGVYTDKYFNKRFTVSKDTMLKLFVSLDVIESKTPVFADSSRVRESRFESEIHLAVANPNWSGEESKVYAYGFSGGFASYALKPWTSHVAGMIGSGMGFTHYQVRSDTGFMDFNGKRKINEYAHYFYGNIDLRLRFSTANLLNKQQQEQKGVMDLGLCYNFPFSYQHIVRYPGNVRIAGSRIHQFSDVRVYANVGFSHIMLYAEYRALDFLRTPYAEWPRWTFGIRLFALEQ